ncbi:MAG: preprotein translocase subunit YajC [Legionellaceae bacterium]|nr:preprotein translocase subunit YajC [Legionellaceae bacterium]HAF87592.1 preprotein translocase subunit YajC [Legionellales bacterium]HCA90231.1 preprotein translocase subunit YajC [Legionellales bacterium]|tara:strand:+ start:8892 stop:9224 length:333 start_codon:yes stop_codon:yes gene_type:complete
MSLFISEAIAATSATPAQHESTMSLMMIVAIFVLFYFMLIRPQSKRAKEQRQLVESLKKGDEIMTQSGFLAKVIELDEQYLKVALNDDVQVYVQRNAVTTILPKGTLKSL